MKKSYIIPLLCAFTLVGCQNAKPNGPTYTITIQETEHFIPFQTSFTFKENDFSTITLDYDVDSGYKVYRATASDYAANCNVSFSKNQIAITPTKNMDFSISVGVTKLSNVSVVEIKGDNHFNPATKEVVFLNDDFSPITIPCTCDPYCSFKSVVSGGRAVVEIDPTEEITIITPRTNGHIVINVTSTEQYKIVHFNPGVGELYDFAEEYIQMVYDAKWRRYVDIGKQGARYMEYNFKGWTFKANPSIGDEVISPDYIIDKDTSTEAYAVFQHNIKLTSNSLSVDKIAYLTIQGEPIIEICFSLKNEDKYILPGNAYKFALTNKDKKEISVKDYKEINNKAYIQISNDDLVKDGIINIVVEDNQPKYTIDTTGLTNLTRETLEGELPQPTRGEDFKFRLKATVEEGGYVYYVPDDIEVKIGGETVGSKAYLIQHEDEDHLSAIVTIYGNYIKGDIAISATAPFKEGYIYKAYGCGVTFNDQQTGYVEGGVPYLGQDTITIKITPTTNDLTSSNIAVKIDGKDWYAFDNLPDKFKQVFKFNNNGKSITIASNVTTGLFTTVAFHVFDESYDVFAKSSWAEINEIATIPGEYMENFFSIGNEKKVTLSNGNTYTLRIIGFNHDPFDKTSRNASLTIEFEELLVNDDGSPMKKYFSDFDRDFHYEYSYSDYDYYLTNPYGDTLFARLPTALQDSIKWVNKTCNLESGKEEYATKIFALSLAEMNATHDEYENEEGTVYDYYQDNAKVKRKKHFLNQEITDSAAYWSRSIYQDNLGADFIIKDDGGVSFKVQNRNKYGYMAAFCI